MIISYWWDNIKDLHNLFQNRHPKIKFAMEHSSKELPFVDILIKKENRQIQVNENQIT